MTEIYGYHAHVYFDAATFDKAEELCIASGKLFKLKIGNFIKRLIGPHPCWSCQLSFTSEMFDKVLPWLALNRKGLTIFIHPLTGNDYADHANYAIWMGESKQLNLSMFSEK